MELTEDELKMIQMRRRAREAGMMPQSPPQPQRVAVEEPLPPRPVAAPRGFISDAVRTAVCLWLVLAMIYCIVAAVVLPRYASVEAYWAGLFVWQLGAGWWLYRGL